MNEFRIIGRTCKDIYMAGKIGFLTVAVSESVKDDFGNYTDKTEFISCKAFSRTANSINKNCPKGTKIFISGKVCQDKYVDKNGQNVDKIGLIINSYEVLKQKENVGQVQQVYQPPAQQHQTWKAEDNDVPVYQGQPTQAYNNGQTVNSFQDYQNGGVNQPVFNPVVEPEDDIPF